MTYTGWRRGTQAEFLMRHGFEKTLVPRYWIPLTMRGTVALKLGLHRNIRSYIPDPFFNVLRNIKTAYYNRRYGINGEQSD